MQFQQHISVLLSDKEMLLYLMKEILVYLLLWCIMDGCRRSLSVRQAGKVMKIQLSLKCMSSFTFTKDRQWARLASLLGHF